MAGNTNIVLSSFLGGHYEQETQPSTVTVSILTEVIRSDEFCCHCYGVISIPQVVVFCKESYFIFLCVSGLFGVDSGDGLGATPPPS